MRTVPGARHVFRRSSLLWSLVFAASATVGCSGSKGGVGSGGSGGAASGTGGGAGGTSPGSGGVAGPGTGAAVGSGTGGAGPTGTGGAVSGTGGAGGRGTGGAGAGTGGGAPGTGGAGPPTSGVRAIIPLDRGWLFKFGDASGADATAFSDTAWRQVSVPHDWSIEGPNPPANPFSEAAASTGRGGYAPSGISWYRRHFTLPQELSGRRVFVELDGVMGNSDVYVNGTHIGNHPYGYVSFRYDVTASVKFGTTDNVLAVKTNTSTQPASRFYAGAGIYRRARLIATDPVHIGQYATFVTTPAPTTTAATVHVTSSVVNDGAAAASVTVQGVVSDPGGAALAPVTTPAQNIAAGASATFAFDVPVATPKLWDLTAPNLYRLVAKVQVGGATVDDDAVSFGIRDLKFDAGMTLNGKSVKFQGVCLHQDYHGLGLAAPQRAMQRRLAQLKALGVNAIRTAHEPPSPDFLELTDRMGLLVLDEFTDVWTARKYSDAGDYSAYFTKTATTPTGMPTIPTVTGVTPSGAPWWQVDFTGWIMRDRNHPSVALYSMGNEIRDSLSSRTTYLTKMAAMSHNLDPSRSITQALFQPETNGDIGAATNMLLDVWGDNYHVDNVLTAMTSAPTKSGVITEMGTATSTWATVKANAALTGLFMWTGVDYLGESDGAWPTIGAGAGIMDALGGVRSIGYQWQTTWGAPKTSPPATGTTASQVVVKADHTAIVTDVNDISFVQATIADASGGVVSSSTAPVTFAISGPGVIVAVDSASMTEESFRGNVRNAYQGTAYALVQATGPGTITVTATSGSLTQGSATITAADGAFTPCAGTCD